MAIWIEVDLVNLSRCTVGIGTKFGLDLDVISFTEYIYFSLSYSIYLFSRY